jgi:prepilin-type N-terminal cleavage/methylation domain-containing protein
VLSGTYRYYPSIGIKDNLQRGTCNMLEQLKQRKRQEGFTIIEVLIVLAIAGLIMVVVFLAVPNLERSQRNNARKTDANNMLENLSEYVGNDNGSFPTTHCLTYATCKAAGVVSYAPQQLTAVEYLITSAAGGTDTVPSHATVSGATGSDAAYLIAGAVCSGVDATATGATSRDYVIYYSIEDSTGTVCTAGS